ncbi:glycosyltransferase family 4 protein [Lichenicola sp.]|uniref:glycosyltransferase family 4 protein n=1 Tax=Lichenicola sp. TaxID=2804529 RepID=UPI003AFFD616
MVVDPRPPVILQVLPALQAGGVERGTIEIARAIVQAGGTALVASAGGRMVPILERAGAIHITLDLMTKDPLSIWLNAGRLARLIRSHRVDLVHARSRGPAWSAKWAARRTGTPFVTTWHGVYGENVPFKRRYNAVMASGARVIAISRFVAERIAGPYGVGPDRLRIIPRGADTASFDPQAVRGDRIHALAREWALPDGAQVIMLPGRLTAWKGHALLLEALGRLESAGHARDWVCVMVGPAKSGDDRFARALIAQADRLGVRSRLRFAGHCADMPAALALADVVVVPSLKPEPFGRTVVEAQAMQRVVLVAAHGAALETVEPGVTGFDFPPGDAQALAETLRDAMALQPDHREWLTRQARTTVLAHYTMQAMQQATLDVYEELLPRPFPERPLPAREHELQHDELAAS